MARTEPRGGQILDASLTDADFSSASQLTVPKGGTGAATLTGILKGNGTSPFTAVTAPSGTIVGTTDTQTLTNKTFGSNTRIDAIADLNGALAIDIADITSQVNWAFVSPSVTGSDVQIGAWGADTNVNLSLNTKGTGVVKANGVEVTTNTGTQTLTNKTLTSPKINSIRDPNGFISLILYGDTTPANWISVTNRNAGSGPYFAVEGSDTNADLGLNSKGAGLVKANGVPVATTTDTQTLTNKTLTDVKANQILDANGRLIIGLDPSATGTGYNWVGFGNKPSGTSPYISASGNVDTNVDLTLIGQGTGKVIANGGEVVSISGTQTLTNKTITSPKVDLIKDTNGNSSVVFEAVASAVNYVSLTNNITANAPQVKAVGSDTNIPLNLISKGSSKVWANYVEVADISSAQTLTNKTLTDPKINQIKDTSGNTAAQFVAVGGANSFNFYNGGAGASPGIEAVGSDTNVDLKLIAKGTGGITIDASTGQTSRSFGVGGTATNIDMNLTTKGTGVVKANGVEVATISGTQTLTNKTLTDPKINQIKDSGSRTILGTFSAASAVNFITVGNTATGNSPAVYADGTDTNIDLGLNPKGTGVVNANGDQVATLTAPQTLTNKTLTQPRISGVLDTNGNPMLGFLAAASAVSYVEVQNSASAVAGIAAAGTGSNLDLYLNPKGTGRLASYLGSGSTLGLLADGAATNIDWNITTKGTGIVRANGNPVQAGAINGNSSRQSQVVVSGTAYYITGSNVAVPSNLVVGSRFRWTIALDKTAAGTGTFQIRIYRGTNGTTSDTADVTQTVGTQTAVVDNMTVDVEVVVTATGATGSYYWTIIPTNSVSSTTTAAGFGVPKHTAALLSGTVSSVAMNTASLKFGLAFIATTGTPTITVPLVRATAYA